MFWSRPTVSDDMREWISDCFDWFDTTFTPIDTPIVPTKAFFKAPGGTDVDTAALVLEDIKRHLNYNRDIHIQPLDVLSAEYRHNYQAVGETAGTFQQIDGVQIIHYDPEQMHRPLGFINLLAHEVMHARLAGMENDIPGGEDAHELATDLGCIISGFGVFQLQAADDAGWFGYMTQQSRAHALALFLDRRSLDADTVTPYLSPRCKKLLLRAIKDL